MQRVRVCGYCGGGVCVCGWCYVGVNVRDVGGLLVFGVRFCVSGWCVVGVSGVCDLV